MRLLITGGGTGGHLYPGLAVAGLLKERDPAGMVLFVGTGSGLESYIVPREGYPFREISAVKWPRKIGPQVFGLFTSLGRGYLQGLKIIKEFRPQAVFATGGYVSVPLVLAAFRSGIPVFLHEQNAVPGLANRLLARWAQSVFTTFPPGDNLFPRRTKVIHTGLPVRKAILRVGRSDGLRHFGLSPDLTTLLITGGSRGARTINEVMLKIYVMISDRKVTLPSIQVIHLTGKDEYAGFCRQMAIKGIREEKIGKLVIEPYLEKMEFGLAAADLIISRAGAATLAEVTARGIPAVLIPYPFATGNHQYHNAFSLARKDAAVLISEQELTPESLFARIEKLVSSDRLRKEMGERCLSFGRPEAGEVIVRLLLGADSD